MGDALEDVGDRNESLHIYLVTDVLGGKASIRTPHRLNALSAAFRIQAAQIF